MKLICCLYLLLVWEYVSAFKFTDDMAKQCKGFIRKTDKTFNTFYKVDAENIRKLKSDSAIDFEMRFAVMAPSGACILLSKGESKELAYVIAIGANKNTEANIIMSIRDEYKNTTFMKNLLSSVEYRAFNIKQYKDGTIAVAREGDRTPIIVYKDPTPIKINYFSFANWNVDEVNYYFDCPKPPVSECKLFTSKNCIYDTFFNTKDQKRPDIKFDPWIGFEMHFEVMAANDAYLLLSSEANYNYNRPVYRIAIGNGTNSVTEIRKYHKSIRSYWALTHNVLSDSEFRYFNIKIYKDGPIVLSREGRSEPILYIVDDNPISVKYFSFDTSNNVEAQFLYGCSDKNETGKIVVEGQYVPEKKCKKFLRQRDSNAFIKAEDIKVNNQYENVSFEMNFAILAAQDAHLVLLTMPNYDGPIYDLRIGTDSNQKTELRRGYENISGEFAWTPYILSETKYKKFYTKIYKDGTIELGMEGSLRPILNFTDTKAVPVNFFSFCAGSSMDAEFRYDCPKLDLDDTTE
ncbi:unnamed protein product [Leptosia nina]|uniref:Farnesoic acid O-methyl transferase domain-containing protein n=1 Tax=Leptosia nina TaxID=320188 RepID=A0AAV1JGD7_9NEOP